MIPLVSTITAIISLYTWIHGRIACDIYDVKTSDLPPLMYSKEKFEDTKGRQSESVNRRRTDNTMAKRKSTKGQTTIYKNIHIKLKIE